MMSPRQLSGVQLAVTSGALDGDAGAVYRVLRELLAEGMPFDTVLFDVIRPVLAALGDRWQVGDYLIAEEHIASNTIETVVGLMAGSLEQPEDGPHVVVSCVEGDTHSLPARMVAASLLYRGFRTSLLGGAMPAADLGRYLADEEPDALVLTCAMSSHLPGARASIAAGHAANVPVLVGGPAFGEDGIWAGRLGADAWVDQLETVADKLQSWTPDPAAAAAAAAAPPAELADLLGSRLHLMAAAAAEFEASQPPDSPRHHEELGLLFDALAASMTVADSTVLVDFMVWLTPTLEIRRAEQGTALRLVSALRSAVAGTSADAAERLDEAAAALG